MKKAFTDEQVVEAIQQGGRALDEVLVFIYGNSLYKQSVFKLIRDANGKREDAEDVFQDGICQLVMNIRQGKFRGKSSIRTYFITICKNLWYTKFARTVKYEKIIQTIVKQEELVKSPDLVLINRENSEQLDQVLELIGEKCKRVLGLWLLNYSMKEITKIVGYKSDGMTRKKKHECMKGLTAMLKSRPELVKKLLGDL